MAKTGTENRISLKTVFTVIITVAVIIGGIMLVKKFADEKEKGEELRQQKTAEEQAAKEVEEVKKQYGTVKGTTGDTDNTRRYGYDVLYANHGLRVMLIESKIYIDKPELTLDIINESDQKMTISTDYVSVNGLAEWPEFECEAEAGKTVTQKLVIDSDALRNVNINRLRICFYVTNEDFSISEYSKAIVIDYANARDGNWIPPSVCETVYESELYTFSAYPVELREESPRNYYRSAIYLQNNRNADLVISMTGYTLYDKNGSEIDSDKHTAQFYSFMPGKTLTNRYFKLKVDESIKKEELGEAIIEAEIYPRDEEDSDELGRETVIFTVTFDNIIDFEEN